MKSFMLTQQFINYTSYKEAYVNQLKKVSIIHRVETPRCTTLVISIPLSPAVTDILLHESLLFSVVLLHRCVSVMVRLLCKLG